MFTLARVLFLITLAAAPWALAGAPLPIQPWLWAGVWAALAVGLLSLLTDRVECELTGLRLAFALTGVGFMGLCGWQLLPASAGPALQHAVLAPELQVFQPTAATPQTRTLAPAATRFELARMAMLLCTFLGGCWYCSGRRDRALLWICLALNGAALSVFGLVQRATWNEQIFWSIPLLVGGQPFASFVSRNCAAGYLAITLACALAWLLRSLLDVPQDVNPRLQRFPRPAAQPQSSITSRLIAALAILLIVAGILGSFSRGGILASAAALLVVCAGLSLRRSSRVLLLPVLVTILISGGALVWLNMSSALLNRLSSLDSSIASDGRVKHWADILQAVLDLPATGFGWGTYRYLSRAYENHVSYGWFVNADNTYLELLIEGGWPAAALVAVLLFLTGWLCVTWLGLKHSGEAAVAIVVLVSQGLHSIVDFGVLVTANQLTLAALLGSLCPTSEDWMSAARDSVARVQAALDQGRSHLWGIVALCGACLIGALALGEVATAGWLARFRYRLPPLTELEGPSLTEVDVLIAEAERRLTWRPDDAEFRAMTAQLWVRRYRLSLFEELTRLPQTALGPAELWARSQLESLLEQAVRRRGDPVAWQSLLDDPLVVVNLKPAAEHFLAARAACPLLYRIGSASAACAFLQPTFNPVRPLREEAALAPSSGTALQRMTLLLQLVGDHEGALICLRRQAVLNPERTDQLLDFARRHYSEAEILHDVIPDRPQDVIRFARWTTSQHLRIEALRQARRQVEELDAPDSLKVALEAQIDEVVGDLDAARSRFEQSVQLAPADWRRRVDFAEFLIRRKEWAAADQQLMQAQRDAPLEAEVLRLRRTLRPRLPASEVN